MSDARRPGPWPARGRRRGSHRAACSPHAIHASHDHTVELQNLLLEPAQLSPKCCETRTRYHRNSLVSWIGDNIEQRLDTLAPDRRDDPELGEMSPDHIDHRGLLADE